jgi:hypothetical protein
MKPMPDHLGLHAVLKPGVSITDLHHALAARMRERHRVRGGSPTEQAARMRAVAPAEVEQLLVSAEEAMVGRFILPGTGATLHFVGNPPAWSTNPTTDDEYIWGLNRMFHWPTLLRAHVLTGDDRYARKVVDELDDWLRRCPRPPIDRDTGAAYRDFYAANAWRSLEAGIRMYESWPVVLEHLAGTHLLNDDLLARLVVSLHEHAEVLADICPIFWPRADHNHYLMENLGLLSICALVPELAHAARWRDHAVRELGRCLDAQVTADGGQIEGCPSYHAGCMYWFCLALRLAQECGGNLPPGFRERLRNGIAYAQHSTRPTGDCVPWGDSDPLDSGLVAVIWWQTVTGDADPLRRLAALTGAAAAHRRIIALAWQTGGLDDLLGAIAEPPAAGFPTVDWQHDLSQASLRSGWDRQTVSVFVACRSPVNNGHAHLDPAGFDLCAFGRALLVDPGRYTYRTCPERYAMKRAAWHNTITIDDRDPFAYQDTWNFGPQQEGRIDAVVENPRVKAAVCRQLNFAPAVHRRLVALVDGMLVLVIDEVTGLDPASRVQIHHHVDSTDVAWDAATGQARAGFPDGVGAIIAVSAGLSGVVAEAMVSTAIDVWHPSRRVTVQDQPGTRDRRHAVVVAPWRDGKACAVGRPRISVEGNSVVCAFAVDGREREVIWTGDGVECR